MSWRDGARWRLTARWPDVKGIVVVATMRMMQMVPMAWEGWCVIQSSEMISILGNFESFESFESFQGKFIKMFEIILKK